MIRRLRSPELARFLVVTVVGVAIDLTISWALAALASVPLTVAALGGFFVAASINYVLHEFWTFAGGERRASAARGAIYFAGLGLTIAVRLAVIGGLERFIFSDPSARLPILTIALGSSFVVNYLFSKFVVFRAPRRSAAPMALDADHPAR